jgi:hypothetical protein
MRPLAVAAILFSAATTARAEFIDVTFAGIEKFTGQPMSGSFSYDTSVAPSITSAIDNHYPENMTFSLVEGGVTVLKSSFFLDVFVDAGAAPNLFDEFRLIFVRPTYIVNGVVYPYMGGFVMFILRDDSATVFPNKDLPTSLSLRSFDMAYVTIPPPPGSDVPLSFTITSLATVVTPEPASVTSLGIAILIVGAAHSRRRVAATRKVHLN